ncbi:MAG: hypothetical protein AAFR64_10000 [Pseudomonadota bacterium]
MTRTILLALCIAMLGHAPAAAQQAENAIELPSAEDSVLGGSEYTKLPETWELSYDIAMQPYVEDYKKCLGYGNLIFDGTANVEKQHRADVPRCADERAEAIEQSNAALVRRGRSGSMSPAEVDEAFDVLGYIHIQRGRNFDDLLKLQQRAVEERRLRYEAQIAARDAAFAVQKTAQTPEPVEPTNAED